MKREDKPSIEIGPVSSKADFTCNHCESSSGSENLSEKSDAIIKASEEDEVAFSDRLPSDVEASHRLA